MIVVMTFTSGSWAHACKCLEAFETRHDTVDNGNLESDSHSISLRIYTSGIISDPTKFESLEQLQDNKLALVCEKLDLKPSDRLLDIGCGWGTLAAYAGKNYGCDVTGG